MVLTPERIMELEQQSYVKGHRPVRTEDCWGDEKITYEPTEHFNMFMFARTIEAEVQKQDTALIRQMLDALEWQERPLCMCWAGCGDCNPENAPNAVAAIAAALKRLEGKP